MSANPLNRLLAPTTLAGLANLELVARTAVEAFSPTASLAALRLQPEFKGIARTSKETIRASSTGTSTHAPSAPTSVATKARPTHA